MALHLLPSSPVAPPDAAKSTDGVQAAAHLTVPRRDRLHVVVERSALGSLPALDDAPSRPVSTVQRDVSDRLAVVGRVPGVVIETALWGNGAAPMSLPGAARPTVMPMSALAAVSKWSHGPTEGPSCSASKPMVTLAGRWNLSHSGDAEPAVVSALIATTLAGESKTEGAVYVAPQQPTERTRGMPAGSPVAGSGFSPAGVRVTPIMRRHGAGRLITSGWGGMARPVSIFGRLEGRVVDFAAWKRRALADGHIDQKETRELLHITQQMAGDSRGVIRTVQFATRSLTGAEAWTASVFAGSGTSVKPSWSTWTTTASTAVRPQRDADPRQRISITGVFYARPE